MKPSIKQSALVTLLGLAILAGLVLGRHHAIQLWWLAAGLLLAGLSWRSRLRPLGLTVLALLIGMGRAGQINRIDTAITSQFGTKVTAVGIVSDDPALSDNNQLSFKVALSRLNGLPNQASLDVYTHRLPVRRGYQVALYGKLKPTIGAAQAEMSFPAARIMSDHLSFLERWRLRFFAAERTVIPEPLASFALGLLVGARALIPKTLQAKLAAVGLSHLVAVSGYNLTILVNGVRRLFRRSSKFFVLALSLWLIAGFVAVTGASASIIRAAVVSVLILAAGYYGREVKPLVLIVLAAALTALVNPHTLWSDLGWQLSFAAFSGILLLAPPLSRRFGGDRHGGIALAFEALAAYFMTLPLIVLSFGTFAPIAPIVNIIVMPLVSLAMLASFTAGLAGLALPLVAGWLSWPATLVLRFIVGMVEQAATLAPVTLRVTSNTVVLYYALAVILIWLLNRPHKPSPTWYNGREEDLQEDVGTLKMAQY